VAFHGSTKSSKILTEWCKDLVGAKMHLNVVNRKTEDNRPLKTSEIKENLDNLRMEVLATQADKIVALGKTAAKALTLLGVEHFEMPHPSGCNRQLNDKAFVERKIKELTEYCNVDDKLPTQ
jgi:uracil-DNA glycosylase